MDPELFQPVGTTGPALVQTVRAKLVCAACPVIAQCRQWALDRGESSGVWAGLSEQDRRVLRADGLLRELAATEPEPAVETCAAGHPFDAENTRWRGQARECRACGADRQREYRVRMRAAGKVAA